MADYEKQHFVPVFYLKRWTNDEGVLARHYFDTNVRDGDNFRIEPKGPRSLGRKRNLWTLRGASDRNFKFSIESEFFGDVDTQASKIADRFIRGDTTLSDGERHQWAMFLVSLRYRNPIVVEHAIRVTADEIRADPDRPPYPEMLEPFRDGFLEPALLQGFVSSQNNIDEFARYRRYSIRRLESELLKFLTCDWPMLKFFGIFDREDPVWVLPLSPVVVLIAAPSYEDTRHWENMPEQYLVREVNGAVTNSFMQEVWASDRTQSAYVEQRMKRRGPVDVVAIQRRTLAA